jgi:hypothetical protein
MDTVTPRIITSPISGQPCKPILKTYTRNGQEIVEAHWIDPSSGTFIQKGLVSATPIASNKKTP